MFFIWGYDDPARRFADNSRVNRLYNYSAVRTKWTRQQFCPMYSNIGLLYTRRADVYSINSHESYVM